MPSPARREVVDEDEVGIYHCYNQVAHQAHLLGADGASGRDYSYRKLWFEEDSRRLAKLMAVDVLDFGILDNHFHFMLRVRPDVASRMSDWEVAWRWCSICPSVGLTRDELTKRPPGERKPTHRQIKRLLKDPNAVAECRRRLSSVSWFMKQLCQPIAVRANRESGTTGRFFAGRFKCKRIEDEAALLACSMYINLNPIRAGLALSPETARHTSAFRRIHALLKRKTRGQNQAAEASPEPTDPDSWLAPVYLEPNAAAYTSVEPVRAGEGVTKCPADDHDDERTLTVQSLEDSVLGGRSQRLTDLGFLPITVEDYLRLLDWTGRQQRVDGPAATIPAELAPILERLGIRPSAWLEAAAEVDRYFPTSFGRRQSMEARAVKRGRRNLRGVRRSDRHFLKVSVEPG